MNFKSGIKGKLGMNFKSKIMYHHHHHHHHVLEYNLFVETKVKRHTSGL